ncbi:hypothetical protein HXX76_003810 [Chlamydomonas incerta]|uniref:Uncharacterized protein n=1 Tax=Chlamydomonas incerta TaxID=51695 RepID=A0A835TC56_CHLIN|nr:hypothetical protein HXX76_003810 [Chlamydomonas incerta]|eukprot:KAG2440957.1 hypothetical protein HXX76_003810 [Chlamydomonas incerta]
MKAEEDNWHQARRLPGMARSKQMVCMDVTNEVARTWQPGRRSLLALAPNAQHLQLCMSTRPEDEDEDEEDSEDGYRQLETGMVFPHDHLARLALLGTTAEGRGRVKHLMITCDGTKLELSSVVSALVSQLPGLEEIDARSCERPAGMRVDDRTRPAVLHHSLGSFAPRLRSLILPCMPGMLHGLGALAACSGLEELNIFGDQFADPVELDAQAITDLSRLRHLSELRLRAHDPSGGAHLAALLGGRRPPSLRVLELTASVYMMTPAATARGSAVRSYGRKQPLPALDVRFEAGSDGPGRISRVETQPCDYPVPGPPALDLLSQMLIAATDQLPPRCRRIARLRLESFAMYKWASSDEQVQQSLGPEGPLSALLERCDDVQVEVLELLEARSQAACAVLRALGMPEKLLLRHGCLKSKPPVRPLARAAAAVAPPQLQAGEPRSLSPLRLETATPDMVLREAVERLWRATTEPEPAFLVADDSDDESQGPDWGGGASMFVLLRGAPQLPPPGDGGVAAHRALGRWLDQLAGLPSPADAAAAEAAGASGGATGLGDHLACPGAHVSALCANTFLCKCRSGLDAEELVAALGRAATASSGVGGPGGEEGAEPRSPAPAPAPAAPTIALVPRHLQRTFCVDIIKWAVMQVLLDPWHQQPADETRCRRRSSASGALAATAAGGPSAGRLGGVAVGRMRQLLDLDLALTRQWRVVHAACDLPEPSSPESGYDDEE